ncbi:MAG: DUF4091 domain-containing protein [Planctomycetes bacterium]|nr:DUF4091 domain-containing protein [Planctomycetota bacterium]
MELWVTDTFDKVFFDSRKPARSLKKLDLACARQEREDAQIVVRSPQSIGSLQILFGPLKRSGGGILGPENLTAQFVWCVPVLENTSDNGGGKFIIRRAPDFFPDALLAVPGVAVPAHRAQAVWITVSVPADARPGRYHGQIKVVADKAEFTVPVALEVYPMVLPSRPSLYMTNWLHLDSLEHFFRVNRFSEDWWTLIDRVAANMGAHRQNVILTPLQALVGFHKTEIGFRADFTYLDRWIETFMRHGVADLIEASHLAGRSGGWNSDFAFNEFTLYEPNGSLRQLPRVPVTEPDRQYLLRVFLTKVYEHLVERGWAGRLILHLADEPIPANEASYRHLADFVKSVLPTVRRIDAMMSQGLHGSIEIRVPQIQHVNDHFEARPKNEELWFYTCLAPQGPYPNRFLDYSSLKPRILHWMNWRYRASGYLHWGYNYWMQWQGGLFCNPFYTATGESERLGSGKLRLPPGDPCVVYPGDGGIYNSIRWEMVRKGMEDYEYLRLLEERIAESKPGRPAARAGQKLLDSFRTSIVESHSKYTTDEQTFLKARRSLTDAILALEK